MGMPLRILLVEDSEDDALLLVRRLGKAGYDITSERVDTADQMTRLLDEQPWDVVLADYSMPRFSAPAALDILKEKEIDLPFIIVSGAIGEEIAVDALKAGAHDFIMKTNLARLVPAIEREVREKEIRQQRREAEKALRESQRTLSTLMSNLPGMAYRCLNDDRRDMLFVSDGCYDLTGYYPWQLAKHKTISFADLIHPDDRDMIHSEIKPALSERRPFQFVYRIVTADQKTKWVWEKGRAVYDENSRVEAVEGLITDITERKKAEDRIEASLAEKEVLLREIHHRVKNNLQIISSLLNLQSKYIDDDKALAVFRESQLRIRTMALIHEKLYQSRDMAKIDFAQYVKSLINHLFRSYGNGGHNIDLKIDIADLSLGIDTAIPCGMIINELVSNALKYAFPDSRAGEIEVVLMADDGNLALKVRDNGVGVPDHVDFSNMDTLGLQLVNTLAEQLEGTIRMHKDAGTEFTLVFPGKGDTLRGTENVERTNSGC